MSDSLSNCPVNIQNVGPLCEHMHAECKCILESSVDNILHQTSTSRFSILSTFLNTDNSLVNDTTNIVEWTEIRAVVGYISGEIKFIV